MRTFSISEARKRLAETLQLADEEGEVFLHHRDGRMYRISPID